jgi:hypothetical protein
MDAETGKTLIAGLVQIAKWINWLLLSAVALAASVCVLRATGQTELLLGQIKLSVSRFPHIAFALTVVHGFLTWIFVQRVAGLRNADTQISKQAWVSLTNSEAFVFFNMQPRRWNGTGGVFGGGSYVATATDTAFWATLAFAICLIAAVVSSRFPVRPVQLQTQRVFTLLMVACTLASINWVIGSQWAIAASTLSPK